MIVYCKVCKNPIDTEVYNVADYVYRKGNTFYCSYKCMRNGEKKKQGKRRYRWG